MRKCHAVAVQAFCMLLLSKTKAEQELLYRILLELDKYKAE